MLAPVSRAQSTFSIIYSKEVVRTTVQGEAIRKLVGDVVLRSKDKELLCDSAYQYIDKELLKAFGNIQVTGDKERIWADSAYYNTKLDRSEFYGRVVIENEKNLIMSRQMNYSFNLETAFFPRRLMLKDDEGTLMANSGIYFNKLDSAIFYGKIQVQDSTKYAEGDTLFSNRKSGTYILKGNVFIDDTKNKTKLSANYLKADTLGFRHIQGNAHIQRLKKDDTDTTDLKAKEIYYFEKDSTYWMKAYGDVSMWSKRFAARADTAYYADSTAIFELHSKARAWNNRLQMTAPQIQAKIEDDTLRYLFAWPKPFSAEEDSVTQRIHQMTGDSLFVWFEGGKPHKVIVHLNAHMLYYTHDDDEKPDGAMEVESDSLTIHFSEGEIEFLKSTREVSGAYLPETKETEDKKLEGYAWDPDDRPKEPEQLLTEKLDKAAIKKPIRLPRRYLAYLKEKQKEQSP